MGRKNSLIFLIIPGFFLGSLCAASSRRRLDRIGGDGDRGALSEPLSPLAFLFLSAPRLRGDPCHLHRHHWHFPDSFLTHEKQGDPPSGQ